MLSPTNYVAALDEIHRLAACRLSPSSAGFKRLSDVVAALAEYAAAHRSRRAVLRLNPIHDRSRVENIVVLLISRTRRDLVSILHRLRQTLETRKRVLAIVMEPAGCISGRGHHD